MMSPSWELKFSHNDYLRPFYDPLLQEYCPDKYRERGLCAAARNSDPKVKVAACLRLFSKDLDEWAQMDLPVSPEKCSVSMAPVFLNTQDEFDVFLDTLRQAGYELEQYSMDDQSFAVCVKGVPVELM